MIEQPDIKKIKETTEEFFDKMTISPLSLAVDFFAAKDNASADTINLSIKIDEPQILIGQGGQTLFEIQRLLRTILNKKLQKLFYLDLDINDYKKQKIKYLQDLAKDLADQVAFTKEEKSFLPMPAYERRIIHAELSQRTDVVTESQGDGYDRRVVVRPRY